MAVKNRIVVKSILWLLAGLLCCQSLHAQSYITDVRKLSLEDGLSSRFVNTVYKDSRGFMWIATRYGLNRYDGYSFKHYTAENSALTSNSIQWIIEDKDQKLWLIQLGFHQLRYQSIHILDLKTDSIQSFEQAFKTITPFTVGNITHIYSDTQKNIWILTAKNEIYRYRNGRFEYVFSVREQILTILYADDKYIWLQGKDFIMTNMQGDVLKRFSADNDLNILAFGKDNDFWLFQSQQKKLLQGNNNTASLRVVDLTPLKLPEKLYKSDSYSVFDINYDDSLIWWYHKSIPESFFVIHPQKGIVFNLYSKIKPFLTYGDLRLHSLYSDDENRVWAATDDGVFIISLKENKFNTLLSNEAEKYSTRAIVKDDQGYLYISFYDGNALVHPETGAIQKNYESPVWLSAARDSRGNLWFGAQGNEIEKYDPLDGQSLRYFWTSDAIGDVPWEQWAIIRAKTGKVWTGTYRGLYSLEPETGLYQRFERYNAFTELRENSIYHLQEDEKGIRIASASGLYLLEPAKGITARYASDEKTPYHIPSDHILHFHRDTAGIFWLATRGGGLTRFNPEDGSYRRFTTADGLSSNIIYAVYEDDFGKLWLPGNYGLMQFDKNTYQVNTYLKGDGIANNEFNTSSHYQDSDGTLYFGGLTGVTVFHPKDFTAENTVLAPLRITGCRTLNGKTGELTDKTTAVSNSGKLTLSPSDRSFIIDFALLNYENSVQNSYFYKIEGLDKTWTNIEENRLRINGLPYGRYTLRIKAQGIKGERSVNEITIPILVSIPFYLENWFILTCVFVLALLIYGIFRWRLQNLRKAKIRLRETVRQRTEEIRQQKDKIELQAGKLQELDRAKSRFFANISHELRTPLTLIVGHLQATLREKYGRIGQRVRSNLEVSRQNSRRLLNMIEEILDLSKMEAGKLELHNKTVKLYPLIDRLCDTFRSYIKGKNIHFSWRIALDTNFTVLLDQKKFEKIVTNLLSNAVKFTPAGGSISVSIEEIATAKGKENKIKLTVRDSGSGIHPKDLPHIFDRFYQGGDKDTTMEGGTGIGLALSKELAGLLGGSLNAESQVGKGSVFTFVFPKKQVVVVPQEVIFEETSYLMFPDALLEKQDKTPQPDRGSQTPIILIVEDHPEMRSFIRQQIAGDYRVLEAGDGVEALQMLKKHPVDLVLSDVMMPRMDGFQLLSTLRASPATADISVIMLTARAAREDRLHALTIGVDDYLTKPFDEEELMARIRHSLKNRVKRQRWNARLPETEKEIVTADSRFLTRAEAVVVKAIPNHSYSVIDMAEDLNLSKSHLFRKIKAATGLSPLQFIREIRLQKARVLLENKEKGTVAEVMYAVGFQKSDYFARVYRERFGRLPSTY